MSKDEWQKQSKVQSVIGSVLNATMDTPPAAIISSYLSMGDTIDDYETFMNNPTLNNGVHLALDMPAGKWMPGLYDEIFNIANIIDDGYPALTGKELNWDLYDVLKQKYIERTSNTLPNITIYGKRFKK